MCVPSKRLVHRRSYDSRGTMAHVTRALLHSRTRFPHPACPCYPWQAQWKASPLGQTVFDLATFDRFFETLLRLKGNLFLVGTVPLPDENSIALASRRGLVVIQVRQSAEARRWWIGCDPHLTPACCPCLPRDHSTTSTCWVWTRSGGQRSWEKVGGTGAVTHRTWDTRGRRV